MSMVVQHNMQAMNANRMLGVTTGQQAKSTEKLSSGYKINRAADDAAGLTISEKMRKQIRGLDQASTNAQDGVSAVQTAEGALTEVHSMLQRMNELAVQASNGTNSKGDRDAIQAEIEQLTTEIDRVAETTKFNEIYLLKGDDAQTKNVYMKGHDAGLKGTLTDKADSVDFTIEAGALDAGKKVTIGGKEYSIGLAEADAFKLLNDTFTATAPKSGDELWIDDKKYTYYAANDKTPGGVTITAAMEGWFTEADANDAAATAPTVAKAGFAAADVAGVQSIKMPDGTAFAVMADADKTKGISSKDSSVITADHALKLMHQELLKANNIGTTDQAAKIPAAGTPTYTAGQATTLSIDKGYATVQDRLSFNLHVGSDADMTNKIQVDIETMNASYLGVKKLNVSDDTGNAATYAIDAIADAVAKVSEQRSDLGAVQNRLEHTIANLDNIVENTTSAESRIRDTDMAEEMVEYSKNNILAQAGQSMLAQANQSNQGVLSLLG